MMLFLRINVLSHAWQQRFAYGNCKILILPVKFASTELILIYPVRRFSFKQPHYLIQVLTGTQRHKAMNMLNPTVQCPNKNILCFRIFSNMLEDSVPDRFGKQGFAIFCCPNEMYPNADVWHTN